MSLATSANGINATCRDVRTTAAIGVRAEVTDNRQTDAIDPRF
jgi:hypothetical protein